LLTDTQDEVIQCNVANNEMKESVENFKSQMNKFKRDCIELDEKVTHAMQDKQKVRESCA